MNEECYKSRTHLKLCFKVSQVSLGLLKLGYFWKCICRNSKASNVYL